MKHLLKLWTGIVIVAQLTGQVRTHDLSSLYLEAQEVVIASLGIGKRADTASGTVPLPPPRDSTGTKELYPCLFPFQVHLSLKKGGNAPVTPNILLWYTRSSDCTSDYIGERISPLQQYVWFLRTERRWLRPVQDTLSPPRLIGPISKRQLSRWSDGRRALSYALLAPGIGKPNGPDYGSALRAGMGAIVNFVGWGGVLEVLRSVYAEGNERTKAQLCVAMADLGMCIACAQRAARAGSVEQGIEDISRSLQSDVLDRDERVALWALDRIEDGVRTDRLSRSSAESDLALHACHSRPKVSERARRLLKEFHLKDLNQISCIPCETGGN